MHFILLFSRLERANHASYEYNYRDVKGRGMRFAAAEVAHFENSKLLGCPCCATESLVLYNEEVTDVFRVNEKILIEWVKCYTCEYHLRYNVGDLSWFGFETDNLFHRP